MKTPRFSAGPRSAQTAANLRAKKPTGFPVQRFSFQLSAFLFNLFALLAPGFQTVNYLFAFAIGIGIVAGLRSLTAPAVLAWAAHLGWLNLNNSPLAFMGTIITAVIFSILALFELFIDLQPQTPKRTAPFPLTARILTGGLCGACLCAANNQSLIIGAALGAVGGVIGAFTGYEIRRRLVAALNIRDLFIGLLEDLVTIGLACFFVSR